MEKQAESSSKDLTLNDVMEAIRNLSVDVNEIKIRHNKISNRVFDDIDQSRTLERIRKAENINELADASEIIEWYYEELSEAKRAFDPSTHYRINEELSDCAVLRCKAFFTLQETSKPHLASLTPRCAQQILHHSSSGTLATDGIIFKKEQKLWSLIIFV